jgi:hypothetical protein
VFAAHDGVLLELAQGKVQEKGNDCVAGRLMTWAEYEELYGS